MDVAVMTMCWPGSRHHGPVLLGDGFEPDRLRHGCRDTFGDFRGVSTFDEINPRAKDVEWFYIPEGTEIPAGLAVTRDGIKLPGKPLHHTIAPRNNMPFTLFLQHLKGFEAVLKKA